MENQQQAGRPALKKKAGAISVACWENEGKGMDGQPTTYISLSIQRTYNDKEGQWQHATNYRVSDIPKIQLCLDEVYKHYTLKEVDTETAPAKNGLVPKPSGTQPPYGFRRY
jgi:hypothetical protein